MCDISLKHVDSYRRRLLNFAKAIGIQVIYTAGTDDGAYIPSKNKIKIGDNFSDSTEIATLLHELGHVISDIGIDQKEHKVQDGAYRVIYTEKYTQRHLEVVLACEKKAWCIGRNIASALKIKLGSWYLKEEKAALKSYRRL